MAACLFDRLTGKAVAAVFRRVAPQQLRDLPEQGWNFDWAAELQAHREVYAVYVSGRRAIQGLVSLSLDNSGRYCQVHLVESAPDNVGSAGRYDGVGGFLFAVACKRSMGAGYDGYVGFVSKSGLVRHYVLRLGAEQVGTSNRMMIRKEAAQALIARYLG